MLLRPLLDFFQQCVCSKKLKIIDERSEHERININISSRWQEVRILPTPPSLPFHAGTVVDIHIHPKNNKNIDVVVAAAVVVAVVVAAVVVVVVTVVVVVIVVFDSELHNM